MDLLKETLTAGQPVKITLPIVDRDSERFAVWLTLRGFNVERQPGSSEPGPILVNGASMDDDADLGLAVIDLMERHGDYRALHSVMSDTLETDAVDYWAEVKDVARLATNHDLASFCIRDGGYENDRIHDDWCTVDAHTIQEAAKRIVLGDFSVRRDLAQQFVGKPRDWDYDEEGLDILMQAICFNRVEYG